MKNLSVALKAHYALGSTTIATCWKATLTNGTVVAATSHSEDIVFDAVTYLSTSAYNPTDVETSSELSVDNLELEGLLASPLITEADILSGVWDFATIEWFEVNYMDLTMGRNRIRDGKLGEVRAGSRMFKAELRGLLQRYSRTIVRLITKECPWTLGDSRCTKDLTAFTTSDLVVQAVTSRREFGNETLTDVVNWYTGGKVTFTSGLNAGLSMEIKEYDGTGIVKLTQMMPFAIQVDDAFTIVAGCLKRFTEDCIGKFNNADFFGGYPHLPLTDAYAGPTR